MDSELQALMEAGDFDALEAYNLRKREANPQGSATPAVSTEAPECKHSGWRNVDSGGSIGAFAGRSA